MLGPFCHVGSTICIFLSNTFFFLTRRRHISAAYLTSFKNLIFLIFLFLLPRPTFAGPKMPRPIFARQKRPAGGGFFSENCSPPCLIMIFRAESDSGHDSPSHPQKYQKWGGAFFYLFWFTGAYLEICSHFGSFLATGRAVVARIGLSAKNRYQWWG